MRRDLSKEEAEIILNALKKALLEGPWDKSTFLKAIGNKLQAITQDFQESVAGLQKPVLQHKEVIANRFVAQEEYEEVYILLYSVDGNNLRNWERILSNLSKQAMTRPIYANEVELKAFLRTKEPSKNDAYVHAYVHKSDILAPMLDKIMKDKLGQTLLTLKDRAVKLGNIIHFYHQSGIYRYKNTYLIREEMKA